MSKLDPNRVRAAGIDAGDRARTGNDRGVRVRYVLRKRKVPSFSPIAILTPR